MEIKLDLISAYNLVEWDFLQEMMEIFRLSTQFIQLIMKCVTILTFEILFNGELLQLITPIEAFSRATHYHLSSSYSMLSVFLDLLCPKIMAWYSYGAIGTSTNPFIICR